MPLQAYRALIDANAKAQRQAQIQAMVAARSAHFDGKAFERVVRSLSGD